MSRKSKAALAVAVASCAMLLGRAGEVRAADRFWDGGGTNDNFSNATNWVGDTVPVWTGQADDLHFAGEVRLNPFNDIANADINGLYFDAGAGAFVISGNVLSIGSAASNTTDRIVNNSGVTQTISTAVRTRFITISAASGDIVFNGSNLNIGNSGDTSGRHLTVDGAFDTWFNIQGDIVGGGVIGSNTYSHNITKNGSGTLHINQTGNNTWYGQMSIVSGAVRIYNNNALGQATSGFNTIIRGNTGGSGRLELTNNISVAEFITLEARQGSTLDLPHIVNISGNNTLTGPMSLTTGGSDYNLQSNADKLTITSNLNTPSSGDRKIKLLGDGDGELSGVINAPGGVATLGITKRGAGTWTLSGNNTMGSTSGRGILSVEGGRLVISGNSATRVNTNINGGTLVVSGSMSDAGAITIASGGLEVSGNIGTATDLTVNGGTAVIKSTGWIGTNLFRVMDAGTLDVTDFAAGYALGAGQVLTGTGTVLGRISAGGSSIIVAGNAGTGALTLGGLSLEWGSVLDFTLGLSQTQLNVANANGLVANGGTTVNVMGAGLTVGQYTLIDYAGTLGGNGLSGFTLGALPSRVSATLVNNVANSSIDLNVLSVDTIKWTGAVSDAWDINSTVNWREINSGNATTYLENYGQAGDDVRFDDTATGSTWVNLTTNVNPARVIVDNSELDYVFTGWSKIGGSGGLVKRGDGTLTIANQNANDYSGVTTIEAGIVQVGDININSGYSGTLGTGPIVNDGTIVFARVDNTTVANAISGAGAIEKTGEGVLTLSGASSYDGTVTVKEGTLRLGNAAALGSVVGGTSVLAGATLDVNGTNIGYEQITIIGDGVNGAGALVNNGAQQQNALRHVTLAGDATIGGTGRFDVRGEGVTFTGNGHKLTKVGGNLFAIINAGETNIGDIVIHQGTLAFESGSQTGSGGTITINREGSLQLYDVAGYTVSGKPITSYGGRFVNWQGANVYEAPVTLEIDHSVFDTDTEFHVPSGPLTLPNVVSGPGDLRKTGGGSVVLAGANTYTGITRIVGGTVVASVLADGGLPSSIGQSDGSSTSLVLEGGTLRYSGEAASTNRLFTLAPAGGTINASGTGAIQFTNANWMGLSSGGARTLTLSGVNTGDNLLAATIGDDGINATHIAKRDAGTWVLNGNNNYIGITTIHGGTLKIASDNALGSTVGITRILDNTNNPAPAALHLDSATGITVAENFETTGGGGGNFSPNGPGVIRNVRGNNTLSGVVTLISGGGDSVFTVDAGSTLTFSGRITNATGTNRTVFLGGAGQGFVTGVIDDTAPNRMHVNKVGAGTWTLAGANTYTGNTTITEGTLRVGAGGSILGPSIIFAGDGNAIFDVQAFGAAGFSLNSGQTLSGIGTILGTLNTEAGSTITLATAGTTGTLSFQNGGLTLRGGTLNFDLAAIAASDMIQLGSGLLATGGQTTTINLTDRALEVGTYTLIDYGSFMGSLGDFNLVPSVLGGFALSLVDSGTSIDLIVSAGADLNQWVSTLGNYGNPGNWKTGVLPSGIGETARFWSLGSGPVTVDAPVTLGTISIDNAVAYNIGGPAAITLDAGAALPSIKAVSGSHTISAPLVLNATTIANVQSAGSTLTISGEISGAGKGLTMMGLGTLVLSGENTYTGPTRLESGVLAVTSLKDGGVASPLGASPGTAGNLVLSGGTLRYTGTGDSTNRLFQLGVGALGGTIQASGTGPVNFTATGPITFLGQGERTLNLGGTNTGANTLAAAIGDEANGATSLAKHDAGTWVLSGNSTYTGATMINNGLLIAASPAALGSAAAGITVRADTGGTLGVQGDIAMAKPVGIFGSASTVGLRNIAGINTWTGQVALAGAGTGDNYRIQSDAGKLTIAGGIVNNVPAGPTAARTIVLQGDGDGEVSGVIGGGTGPQAIALNKGGAGTWTLSNWNTFSGNVHVSAGVLRITSSGALGDTVGGTSVGGEFTTGQLHLDGGLYIQDERLTLQARQPGNATPHVVNVGGDNIWAGPVSFNTGGANYMFRSEAGKLTLAGAITNDTGTTNTGQRYLYLGGASDGEVTGSIGGGNAPGPINVIKDGAGTWTISGYNTYAGTTRVAAGTLKLTAGGSLATSAIHVDAGATFDVSEHGSYFMQAPLALSGGGTVRGGIYANWGNNIRPGEAGVAGTLTIEGDFISYGATLHYDLTSANTVGGGVNDLLVVKGSLTSQDFSPTEIVVNPIGGVLAGAYRLIDYDGAFHGSAGGFTVNSSMETRLTYQIDTSTPQQVNLVVTGSAGNLIWNGDGFANAWDLGTYNWKNPVNPDRFYTLDSVTFDDTGSNTPNVNLTTALAPGAVTVNSTKDYAFGGTGRLTGAMALNKLGTGMLTLSTANDFTGTVTISDGTLRVGHASALGTTAGATVINGTGTLDLNGFGLGLEPIRAQGAGVGGAGAIVNSAGDQQNALRDVTLTGDATFGGTGRWDIRKPSGSVASLAANGHTLTKTGPNFIGLIDLGETGIGDLNINEGTLSFEYATTLGDPAKTATVRTGGTLMFWNNPQMNDKVLVLDGGSIFANGPGSSPPVTVQSFVGPVTLASESTVQASGNQTLVLSGNITGPGRLVKVNTGVVSLTGTNDYAGGTTVSAGTLRVTTNSLPGDVLNEATLAFNQDFEGTYAGTISGTGAVVKQNTGTVVLAGDSDYTGVTTVNNGVLRVVSPNALGSTAGITRVMDNTSNTMPPSLQLASETSLTIAESFETTGSGSGGFNPNGVGVIRNVAGDNTITGNIRLISGGGDSTFTVDAGTRLTLAGTMTNDSGFFRTAYLGGAGEGVISGAIVDTSPRTMSVNKVGAGTWTLLGANTYTGTTTVTEGTLAFGASQKLTTLAIAAEAVAKLAPGGDKVVGVSALNMAGAPGAWTGLLDLQDNALAVLATAGEGPAQAQRISEMVQFGLSSLGAGGIASTAGLPYQGLAVVLNDAGDGTPLTTDFGGLPVDIDSVLVRNTWHGDTDVNGIIDGDDYFRIDRGFLMQPANPLYADGDINYDGVINAKDYFLMDAAYLHQSATPLSIGNGAMVPEPGTLSLLAAATALLGLRRRRNR